MKRKSNYVRLEESRNRRLWITEVIKPVIASGTALYIMVPEFRKFVDQKLHDASTAIDMKREEIKTKKELRKAKKEAQ